MKNGESQQQYALVPMDLLSAIAANLSEQPYGRVRGLVEALEHCPLLSDAYLAERGYIKDSKPSEGSKPKLKEA